MKQELEKPSYDWNDWFVFDAKDWYCRRKGPEWQVERPVLAERLWRQVNDEQHTELLNRLAYQSEREHLMSVWKAVGTKDHYDEKNEPMWCLLAKNIVRLLKRLRRTSMLRGADSVEDVRNYLDLCRLAYKCLPLIDDNRAPFLTTCFVEADCKSSQQVDVTLEHALWFSERLAYDSETPLTDEDFEERFGKVTESKAHGPPWKFEYDVTVTTDRGFMITMRTGGTPDTYDYDPTIADINEHIGATILYVDKVSRVE